MAKYLWKYGWLFSWIEHIFVNIYFTNSRIELVSIWSLLNLLYKKQGEQRKVIISMRYHRQRKCQRDYVSLKGIVKIFTFSLKLFQTSSQLLLVFECLSPSMPSCIFSTTGGTQSSNGTITSASCDYGISC